MLLFGSIMGVLLAIAWPLIKSAGQQSTTRQGRRQVTEAQLRAAQREQGRLELYHANGWTEQDLHQIDKMTGVQFEQYVAGFIRSCGCTVKPTRATGDFGVDLIVNDLFAVQCKRQSKPVGTAAIQQVIAGARMHRCSDRTTVVANQNYTPAAREIGDMHGVMLFGRDNLPQMREFWTALARSNDQSA